jgi:hypothetical protein
MATPNRNTNDVAALSSGLRLTALAPTIWQYANLSEPWYRDAVREAQGKDTDSTRREIVFVACFLESYIFEWTRSISIGGLNKYFPAARKRSLKEKWKEVPAELYVDKIIPVRPALDLSELATLVKYRNGLIHAQASRPSNADVDDASKPVPALGELDRIAHGWAQGVAKMLLLQLHDQLKTAPPGYL